MMMCGCFLWTLSQSKPIFARDFVRVFVMKMSAWSSSLSMISAPVFDFRFRLMKRLCMFAMSKPRFSSSLAGMPKTAAWFTRPGSPLAASTLMTSAPHSPSTLPVVGVAKKVVRSTTLMPSSGFIYLTLSSCRLRQRDDGMLPIQRPCLSATPLYSKYRFRAPKRMIEPERLDSRFITVRYQWRRREAP